MLPSCEHLHIFDAALLRSSLDILDATLLRSSLDCHTSLMLRWGGVCQVCEFVKTFWRKRQMLKRHTGTMDAAWKLCKSFIPNSLSAKHKDLFLYCIMWQWRYVLHHKNVAKETVKMLKSQS